MHDHDDLQINAVAMVMSAEGRIFKGPDGELYRVIPEVMPEAVEEESEHPVLFFSSSQTKIEVMMTWRPIMNPDNKRYRISSLDMELWADASNGPDADQMNDRIVLSYARQWFAKYGQGLPMPARLLGDDDDYEHLVLP